MKKKQITIFISLSEIIRWFEQYTVNYQNTVLLQLEWPIYFVFWAKKLYYAIIILVTDQTMGRGSRPRDS